MNNDLFPMEVTPHHPGGGEDLQHRLALCYLTVQVQHLWVGDVLLLLQVGQNGLVDGVVLGGEEEQGHRHPQVSHKRQHNPTLKINASMRSNINYNVKSKEIKKNQK